MYFLDTVKFIANHPLNKGNKLKATIHYAKWQIGSRLVPGSIVYPWIGGSRFLVKPGEAGLTGNVYTGLHEFQDMGFLLHALRENDLFVDIGANAGSYTILACSTVGARGIAFEPIPNAYNRLVDNVRLNNVEDHVQCLNIGLSSSPGILEFTTNLDAKNHVVSVEDFTDETSSVEVSTLDQVLKNQEPWMIKIDAEEFEAPILEGAKDTLSKGTLHSILMELGGSKNRYGFDNSKTLDLIFEHNFKPFSYNPFVRSLVELNRKDLDSSASLFIRDVGSVKLRLKTAPTYTIQGKLF